MALHFFETILQYRTFLTDDVFELGFRCASEPEFSFKAGQFVNIRVDDGDEKVLFRSYSVMNSPSEKGVIKTCVKIVPSGRCSTWLSTLSEGSVVTMMGPIGLFVVHEEPVKEFLFVATGTGITPLYSMILDLLEKNEKRSMHMVWGFRYEKDIFYRDFFDGLVGKYSQFSYTVVLSRPEKSWIGPQGRVTDWIEQNFNQVREKQIYICGVGDMVLDVKNLCVFKGVPSENVHFERYD